MGAKKIVIIDYKLGNLYSVEHACRHVGMDVAVSSDRSEISNAAALVLPGVGAFGAAMKNIHDLGLTDVLLRAVEKEVPLFGVCLGLQILFTESEEFGQTSGLGIIPGSVVKLKRTAKQPKSLKVPHIGWNKIYSLQDDSWAGTPLEICDQGEFQYFVHSYVCVPDEKESILSNTNYQGKEFCSSARLGRHVVATQFHPEKSGPKGLQIYRNWARLHKLI